MRNPLIDGLFAETIAARYYFFAIVLYFLLIVAWWRIFQKAGQPGWVSLIPFYNLYMLFKIFMGSGWFFLLELIPVINVVMDIIVKVKLSKAFGYSGAFALGLIFLPNIFLLIIGFDSSRYIGPQ